MRDAELRQRVEDPNEELKYRLRDLFEAQADPAFLLVLDDFEANLEPVGEGFRLKTEAARVLGALMWAIEAAGMGHRVVLTCRYDFEFGGLARVLKQPLAGLPLADVAKKCRQLGAFGEKSTIEQGLRDRALRLADGNPRLLEWLDKVLRNPAELGRGLNAESSVVAVLDRLEAEPAALRERVLADVLVAQMDGPMREMLRRARVYELPVPRGAVVEICEAGVEGLAVEDLIVRAVALGLLEESPGEELRVPRVLPLDVVEDEGLAARAARVLYRLWWEKEKGSSETQRLEVHRLAVEGKDKEIIQTTVKLSVDWINKSRFRESIELCKSALEVVKNQSIFHQLARSEYSVGEIDAALRHYQVALDLCLENKEREKEEAIIIHDLATLKMNQGDVESAIALYQKSLDITEQIGDTQTKASTMHQLATLKANQGDVESAITLYQKLLGITEQIGNVKTKAATLHCLARLKAKQGDVEEAVELCQYSLEIEEEIGNLQGKAATMHQLATLKTNQGDVESAILLYRESLKVTEQIGDVQTEAATLHQLARLKENQGDVEEAIALYQESLEVTVGDVHTKAVTLAMMGQLLAVEKGDFETAVSYWQRSLAIFQRIGSQEAHTVQDILNRISGQS